MCWGYPLKLFSPLAKIAILFCWGFSAWWFVMSCILILHYLRKMELPFALSWWAFTFPSGALCLASAVAWKITGFTSIFYFIILTTAFLLAVWSVVFLRTVKGVASGKIFLPTH